MSATFVSLSLNRLTLQIGGPTGWVALSDPEYCLLAAFATSPDQRLDTLQMLAQTRKPIGERGKRALGVLVVRLRKKLIAAGASQPTIKAIRGAGYQLCVPVQVSAPILKNPSSDSLASTSHV